MGLRILLAGNSCETAPPMVGMLSELGHRVVSVQSGPQALNELQQQHFDLILMDAQARELDAVASTAAIRAQELPLREHTPIVAMSDRARQTDRRRCIGAGVDHYLARPGNSMEVATVLSAVSDPESIARGARPVHWNRTEAMERAGGTEKALNELLDVFAAEKPGLMAKLNLALQAQQAETVEWTALKLAEQFSYIGALDLYRLARDIARLGSRRDFVKARKLSQDLQSRLVEMDVVMSRTQS